MLRLCVIAATLLLSFNSIAQKAPELDKSPMDMSYWPNNYPVLKMSGKAKDMPVARVIYSRPLKNNRDVFGGIIKYREMWRLGANEATEIEFFKNVKIGGKPVAKGRYTVYCIPDETKWTIILSNDNYSWGSFIYDIRKDVLRTDIPVEKGNDNIEAFTMFFDENNAGANLLMMWDNVKATLPIAIVPETTSKKK
ncbi:DUF2911 domain-containing protein [Chitinophagaceae bacterium LWZ2-11]